MSRAKTHTLDAEFPQQIGRYTLIRPIGAGGMATVYLGRTEGIGGFSRDVAVKVLHSHLAIDHAAVEQFLTEARVSARIRDPHVVPVLDVGKDSGSIYLVMEYVEGASLATLLTTSAKSSTPIPTAVLLRIVCDAIEGLHRAHEVTDEEGKQLGLVHRDFSPHNILVGTDGIARLSDFGIVKVLNAGSNTSTGVVKGKVRYLSPEQVRGRPLDRRADVWAAGVVVWEVLAGRRLVEKQDKFAVLMDTVLADPPRLRTVDPGISEELDEGVAWALVRDRSQRCPTAQAFHERIEQAFANQGGLASRDEVAFWCARLLAGLQPLESSGASPPSPNLWVSAQGQTLSSASVSFLRRSAQRLTLLQGLIVALVTAGIVGAGFTLFRGAEPSREQAIATSASAPSAKARRVTLKANHSMVEVKLGDRKVPVADPSDRLVIELRPEERGMITIEAQSYDGRRVRDTVDTTLDEATLVFPIPSASASARSSARPVRKHSPRPPINKPPRLPKSPYE